MARAKQLTVPASSWMGQAACARHDDPDLWFPEGDQSGLQEEALRICATCPVRAECLSYALSMPPQPGIWGGTTEGQRTQERRRRAATQNREAP